MRRVSPKHLVFVVAALVCLPLLHLSAQSAATIDPLLDGSTLNDVWTFQPATNSWTQRVSREVPAPPAAGQRHSPTTARKGSSPTLVIVATRGGSIASRSPVVG